jgi:hypothetical protein
MSASVNNLVNGSSELSDLKTYSKTNSNISQDKSCDIEGFEAHCHLQNAKRYYHALLLIKII